MLISNAAIFDLECRQAQASRRWSSLLARIFGIPAAPAKDHEMDSAQFPERSPATMLQVVAPESPIFPDDVCSAPDITRDTEATDKRFRWRRHPQLLADRGSEGMTESERLARLAAVRGVFAARHGELERAEILFIEAASHSAIDLSVVPGFWTLPRSHMEIAVEAYEQAGRLRDASALSSRIRTRFRLRVIPSDRSGAYVPASIRKAAAGGD